MGINTSVQATDPSSYQYPVDSAAAGTSSTNFQFNVDPKVMDLLQKHAGTLQGIADNGQGTQASAVETPQSVQDVLDQVGLDVNKFDMTFISSDNRSLVLNFSADSPDLVAPLPGTSAMPEGLGAKANPFMTASFILVLVVVMTELQKEQGQMMKLETKLDIMGQKWTMELAYRAADEIMASANTEAMMHYMLAASAGFQLGMAVGTGVAGMGMMVKSIRDQNAVEKGYKTKLEDAENEPALDRDDFSNDDTYKDALNKREERIKEIRDKYQDAKLGRMSAIGNRFSILTTPINTIKDSSEQAGKIYDNLVQGLLGVEKARHEAALKIIEGFQDMARRISQNASDAYKELQQNIDSEEQFMTNIIDKNYQSFNYHVS